MPVHVRRLLRLVLTAAAVVGGGGGACATRGDTSGTAAAGAAAPATTADSASHAIAASGSQGAHPFAAPAKPLSATPIAVTSATFQAGATLPKTMAFDGCGGGNRSPQLSWSNFPPATKSFVITLFDPDAPTSTGFWHWVVFDVPASVTSLPAGAGSEASPAPRSKSGYTDFGFSHYGGPCPPNGDPPHHYIFTVYALDIPAIEGVGPRSTAATVMFSLRGHLLAQGSLEGQFGR